MSIALLALFVAGVILMALVAGVIWLISRHRSARGNWFGGLRPHWPLLLGAHLLIFAAVVFGVRLAATAGYNVEYFNSNLTTTVYSEWAADLWIGPFVACLAFAALMVLLTTAIFPRMASWRGDIVVAAAIVIGSAALMVATSDRDATFTMNGSIHPYAIGPTDTEIRPVSVSSGLEMNREYQAAALLYLVPILLLMAAGPLMLIHAAAESREPRLSRLALWGMVGPAFVFLGTLVVVVLSFSTHGERVAAIMICCPIVMAILGMIAVRKIKRSGGRLYGLRLAALEALLLPWILIIGVIGGLISTLVFALLNLLVNPTHTADGPSGYFSPGIPVTISILPTLAISFFACRALWRGVVGRPVRTRPISPAPKTSEESGGIGVLSLSLAIAGTLVPILIMIAGIYMKSNLPMRDLVVCAFLGFVLEIAALGCGIAGRRAPAGKAGLIISIVVLALYVLIPAVAIPFFVAQPQMKTITTSTPGVQTTKTESAPTIEMKPASEPTTQTSRP